MEELFKVFNYEGNNITFSSNSGVALINATEMAKSFDKQPSDWVRLKSTKAFLDQLSGLRGIPRGGLLRVVNNGINNGTYMHEDVAMEFARWLSPVFAIWCNDRIKELLTVGMTALPQTLEDMVNNPDLIIELATKLKEYRADIERMRPKEIFADAVSGSETSILIGELSKLLKQNNINIGQNRMFEWLRDNNYLGSSGNNRNLPTQKSMNMELFEIVEKVVDTPYGNKIVRTTKVTGKGQQYFMKKFLAN